MSTNTWWRLVTSITTSWRLSYCLLDMTENEVLLHKQTWCRLSYFYQNMTKAELLLSGHDGSWLTSLRTRQRKSDNTHLLQLIINSYRVNETQFLEIFGPCTVYVFISLVDLPLMLTSCNMKGYRHAQKGWMKCNRYYRRYSRLSRYTQ